MSIPCKLCEKRRAKRHCPGVDGEICPVCCGTERENTVDCPLDCEYLREARLRDRPVGIAETDLPNKDVLLNEDFIRKQEHVVMWLGNALARVMETRKSVDSDAREGLEALIKTYRTLEAGLIYESRPSNPYAAEIQEALKRAIDELRQRLTETSGMQTLRDTDVLGALVFLQRLELQHNNGRRRGRAFVDFLQTYFPVQTQPAVVS